VFCLRCVLCLRCVFYLRCVVMVVSWSDDDVIV
jgi:hypothetical protein